MDDMIQMIEKIQNEALRKLAMKQIRCVLEIEQ